jgi:uncharacterized protein (DUF4415 family)/uncharacterized DUF497 family protein
VADEFSELLAKVRTFAWDSNKRDWTIRERAIDFDEVRSVFDGPILTYRSDRKEEARYLVFGLLDSRESLSSVRSVTTYVGSYQRGEREKMKGRNFTIVSRDTPRRKGKTDWARLDTMSDEEIERAVREDPDAVPLDFDWSKAVVVIPPKKKAISIRVDEDVLNYFKKEGTGYQRRINAVLRSYMQQKRK